MTDDNFLLDDSPFGVQGDASIQENNYTTWDDGEYQTKGIHSYIKVDDRKLPIFVPQGDQMVARFKLLLLKKDPETQDLIEVEGPPMSATAAQLRMLVRAHGGKVELLPDEPTSMFLMSVQDQCTKGGVVRRCGVKGGWVKWIEGMNPPIGEMFAWSFEGFWNLDSATPVAFQKREKKGTNGPYTEDAAFAKFKIVADGWGNPTPYAGYEHNIRVDNPFAGGYLEIGGRLRPAMKIGAKGGIPIEVRRFVHFANIFCPPEFNTYIWQEDAEKSDYGINEFDNPLPVVNKLALKAKRVACSALSETKTKAPKLNLEDFVLYKGKELVDRDAQAVEEAKQPSELELFVRQAEKAAGIAIFKPTSPKATEINLEFTTEGLEWAKNTLGPAWDKLELPKHDGRRTIGKLTPEELKKLTNFLDTDGVDSF